MKETTCFVVGIVKGLVEHDDATRFFGSLMGFQAHLADARDCGVVDGEGHDVRLTPLGQVWYDRLRMADLPQGRAYMWSKPKGGWIHPAAIATAEQKPARG